MKQFMFNFLSVLSQFKAFLFLGLFVLLCTFVFGQTPDNSAQNDMNSKSEAAKEYSRIKVGFQIGYGYRIASVLPAEDPIMNIHFNKLKNNLSLSE